MANWNDIFRSPCPLSSLSQALLCVIRDRVPKRTIVVRTDEEPWFEDWCVSAYFAKQTAYRMWSLSRTQADWVEYRLARRYAQLLHVDAE